MKVQTTRVYSEVSRAIEGGFALISCQGSARSGKTYNIMLRLIVYLLEHPKTELDIVRKTLPALKGSVFKDFKDWLDRLDLFVATSLNKTELTYKFENGSSVAFFSTDNEQKLRGRKRHVLFVNEANELSPLEFQQLMMRTTRFAVIDYNPSFSDEHWIAGRNRDARTYHFISTYKDNPFLEQSVVDEIESLRYKNPSLWRIYGEGLQAQVEGLVFKEFDIVERIPPRVKRRWRGVDFGYTNDPTAIVEVGFDGETLYVDELCYRTEMLTADIVRVFKEQPEPLKVISESADPRLVQEIYRAGIDIHPVRKFAGSIEAGIAKMQELRIALTARSWNAQKEWKQYVYRQDKEGHWLNQPIDYMNHAIDAVRYVVMEEIMGGRRKPVDLERLSRRVRL